jgi:hemerythrin superfamily protein
MTTAKQTETKRISTSKGKDVITLLRADHKLVSTLFTEYENTRTISKKKLLVSQICTELSIHAQVEEEIFYPAVKKALKDKEMIPEAMVEHATLKELISQIEVTEPNGEMFDAKMKVLSEYVKHHVKEEQNEIFPQVKSSKLDLDELADKITARKEEIKMENINKKEPLDGLSDSASNMSVGADIGEETQGNGKETEAKGGSSKKQATQKKTKTIAEAEASYDSKQEKPDTGPAPLDRY